MSTGTAVIINLLGGVALLLWGVRMVHTGMTRAWGERLRLAIERSLGNPARAFAAGVGVTLFLQSGTATALIVASLAAGGVFEAATGLAVLLGADLGSAFVVAVYALIGPLIMALAPALLFAGFVTFSASSGFKPRNAGRIMLGLGLMLLALRLIVEASEPLRDAGLFIAVLQVLDREPVLGVLIGALVTWLSHSTLAMSLLIVSLLAGNALDVGGALPLLAGLNLGGGMPALVASWNGPAEARRLPAANLLCRAALALAVVPFLPAIETLLADLGGSAIFQAVLFHVCFNAVLALLALPFAGPISRRVAQWLPAVKDDSALAETPRYLDAGAIATPVAGLANAQAETLRMTELLDRMVAIARDVFRTGRVEELKQLAELDARLNAFQREIHGYLAQITEHKLDAALSKRAMDIVLYVSNLEHAGDIIHLSLRDRLKTKQKASMLFAEEEADALDGLFSMIRQSLKYGCSVVTTDDVDAAMRLMNQKDEMRITVGEVLEGHFARALSADPDALKKSALFVDMVRDLQQVHSHIVSAAYPVIEAVGLLRDSRVRRKRMT